MSSSSNNVDSNDSTEINDIDKSSSNNNNVSSRSDFDFDYEMRSYGSMWSNNSHSNSNNNSIGYHNDLASRSRSISSIRSSISDLRFDDHSTAASTIATVGENSIATNSNDNNNYTSNSNSNSNPNSNSTSTQRPVVQSLLHDAARITDWDTVLQLSQTSPHLASYRCPDGITPLHHVCTRRCNRINVYSSLLHAHPRSLIAMDERGWTPLHHAARFKAPSEAVRVLLESYPEYGRRCARRRCGKGRTPLYYAIRYDAPKGVVELLLEFMRMEDVLDGDKEGTSVLGLVWDSWVRVHDGRKAVGFLAKKLEGLENSYSNNNNNDNDKHVALHHMSEEEWMDRCKNGEYLRKNLKGKIKDKWDMANLLLRGAFRFPLHENTNSKSANGRKWRVLHATAAARCHPSLFMMACVLHPEQAREIDENDLYDVEGGSDHRRTALHFAALKHTKHSKDAKYILKTLLSLHPHAISFANPVDGALPLHYVCRNELRTHWVNDGVEDIYGAYPDAAMLQDENGRTPIHHATSVLASRQGPHSHHVSLHHENINHDDETPSSVVIELVKRHPKSAQIADIHGKLPMHVVASEAESWCPSVQYLYEAHPLCLRQRTSRSTKSRLPLHLAAMNPDATSDLLEKMVSYDTQSATRTDGNGKLPFHYVCEAGKSWLGGSKAIYDAFPSAINTAEDNGRKWLPLHCIVTCPSAPMEIVEKVLSLNVRATRKADRNGRLPLHLAVESGKDWECIRMLFRAYPDGLYVEDVEGCIPFVLGALTFCEGRAGQSQDGGGSERTRRGEDDGVGPLHLKRRSSSGASYATSISQTNVLFSMLQSAPHVVKGYGH